jgi:putative ABC transport system substrate-binding protein
MVPGRALLLAVVLLCASVTAWAQPTGKVWRIGVLGTTSPEGHGAFVEAFRAGLRERGYVEGKHVVLEYRWAGGDYARLPGLAAELARPDVDLILTHGTPGARAAKGATSTIPIVVAVVGDPIATGLVPSLARPGGNLTGSAFSLPELNAKRLEMLREALPRLKRVAVLMNDANPANVATFHAMTQTARAAGLEVSQILAHNLDDMDAAFAQIVKTRAEAVSVYEDPLFTGQVKRLASLAERHRLPSIGFHEYAEAGGLLAFGVNFAAMWRRAAGYADRIFKGAKPSDLPMEQPEKFDTVVNLRTAKALRLTIPPNVLLRADMVIE